MLECIRRGLPPRELGTLLEASGHVVAVVVVVVVVAAAAAVMMAVAAVVVWWCFMSFLCCATRLQHHHTITPTITSGKCVELLTQNFDKFPHTPLPVVDISRQVSLQRGPGVSEFIGFTYKRAEVNDPSSNK